MLLHSAPDPTLHVENLGTVDGPHRHSSRCSCSSLQGARRAAPVRIFRNHPPSRDCSAEYTTPPVLRRTHLLECANGPRHIRKYCVLTPECEKIMENAVTKLGFSARCYDRILKRNRTR